MVYKVLLLVLLVAGLMGLGKWEGRKVQDPQPKAQEEKVDERESVIGEIRQLAATASGAWAVYVQRLESGESYGVNEKEAMPAASILKIPALMAVENRKGETWTLEEADRASGSGPLQFAKVGSSLTVERVMMELGRKSDNTAWRMINRRIGYQEIEKRIQELGLKDTNYRELTTTVEDVGAMMKNVYENPDLWPYLEESIYEDRISLGLPVGTRLIHKVGTDAGVWSDAGIVLSDRPFILVVLNKDVVKEEAAGLVLDITRKVWGFETGRN